MTGQSNRGEHASLRSHAIRRCGGGLVKIQVKLFAALRELLPDGRFPYPVDVPEGTPVADLLHLMRIPEEQPKILLVNGRYATKEQTLGEGDVLSVLPPVAGG
jgi:molybdopterin converting factor small subunit